MNQMLSAWTERGAPSACGEDAPTGQVEVSCGRERREIGQRLLACGSAAGCNAALGCANGGRGPEGWVAANRGCVRSGEVYIDGCRYPPVPSRIVVGPPASGCRLAVPGEGCRNTATYSAI